MKKVSFNDIYTGRRLVKGVLAPRVVYPKGNIFSAPKSAKMSFRRFFETTLYPRAESGGVPDYLNRLLARLIIGSYRGFVPYGGIWEALLEYRDGLVMTEKTAILDLVSVIRNITGDPQEMNGDDLFADPDLEYLAVASSTAVWKVIAERWAQGKLYTKRAALYEVITAAFNADYDPTTERYARALEMSLVNETYCAMCFFHKYENPTICRNKCPLQGCLGDMSDFGAYKVALSELYEGKSIEDRREETGASILNICIKLSTAYRRMSEGLEPKKLVLIDKYSPL